MSMALGCRGSYLSIHDSNTIPVSDSFLGRDLHRDDTIDLRISLSIVRQRDCDAPAGKERIRGDRTMAEE